MSDTANNPMQRRALTALAFVVGAFLVYALALNNPFLIDDHSAITQHPDVQETAGVLRLWTHHYWEGSPSLDDQLYRPITVFSYWLSQRLTPGSAAGFRAVNLLLLAGIALCVASWLRRHTGDVPALIAGALVLVHPANTEAINHLVGRADLLAVFGIVGFLAVQSNAQQHGWTWPRIAGAAALAFVALGSKESGLALVPCALAQWWIGTRDRDQENTTPTSPRRKAGVDPTDETTPRLAAGASAAAQDAKPRSACATADGICPKRALFLALFLPAALYAAARLSVVGLPAGYAPTPDDLTGNPLRGMGFFERLPEVLAVAGWHLKQLVWPSTAYNHTPAPAFVGAWRVLSALGVLAYAVLIAGSAALCRKRHPALIPAVLLLAHLLIVGHLLTVTGAYAANRLSVAVTVAVAMLLGLGIRGFIRDTALHFATQKLAILLALGVAVPLFFAFLTARANRAWSSELARMHADVQANDEDPIALYWLGQAQLEYAPDAAVSHLKRAHALAPQSNQAAIALADALLATGDDRAAWKLYDELLARNAPLTDTQRANAAMAAFNTGRYEQARALTRSLSAGLAEPIEQALRAIENERSDGD